MKIFAAALLLVSCGLVFADAYTDCLTKCETAYDSCIKAGNTSSACLIARKKM